jgi:hypothetical protein
MIIQELYTAKNIVGLALILAGLLDAWKYIWHIQAIHRVNTSKGHSRKFANAAITQDLVKLMYGIVIYDLYIILSTILALITMSMYFYTLYKFYPYRNRNKFNFKPPNILTYTVNSLLPNRIRRRL